MMCMLVYFNAFGHCIYKIQRKDKKTQLLFTVMSLKEIALLKWRNKDKKVFLQGQNIPPSTKGRQPKTLLKARLNAKLRTKCLKS